MCGWADVGSAKGEVGIGCRTPGNREVRIGIITWGIGSAAKGRVSATRDGANLKHRLASRIRVGLVSDTHGLLRPEATAFLSGCQLILHGGDIGGPAILEELATLAPLISVRGNNDRGSWAQHLQETERVSLGEGVVYLIHDVAQLGSEPLAADIRVVVSGHSHQPRIEQRGGVLFVNPGSCGPRRFKLAVAAGELLISDSTVVARIVDLVSGQTLVKS
jgi:putative phosphoesterase